MPKSDSNPFNWKEASQNIIDGLEAEGFKYGVEFEVQRVPNIVNITYGRDVGYKIEQETLGEEIESISATKIRAEMNK